VQQRLAPLQASLVVQKASRRAPALRQQALAQLARRYKRW
jgi:hypothetical protein